MKKTCFKCQKKKDISQFYPHKQMGDGYLGKCKACTKRDVKDRYLNPEAQERIKKYERLRFQEPERKKKTLEYQRKRRLKNKGKNRARAVVAQAIRKGVLKRGYCEICQSASAEAHHPDYRKPLNIKWLCFKHHRELHKSKTYGSYR